MYTLFLGHDGSWIGGEVMDGREHPNCDGAGPHTVPGRLSGRKYSAVKRYPIGGGGNLILCFRCWTAENRFNFERGKETGCHENFPQINWFDAEVYQQEGEYHD